MHVLTVTKKKSSSLVTTAINFYISTTHIELDVALLAIFISGETYLPPDLTHVPSIPQENDINMLLFVVLCNSIIHSVFNSRPNSIGEVKHEVKQLNCIFVTTVGLQLKPLQGIQLNSYDDKIKLHKCLY